MGFITYSQSDSRWGRKNYNGSSTMATAGCGPTACAMIIYGVDGKTTPLDTMKYMQKNGFAIRNNGTAWSGIPSCLKAYGVKNVQNVPNMAKVWELMSKGYVGVFLFRSGSRGGVTWTTSGHYIAVTDYKVQNGRHYIYTRDSGGRNHTGWYCYETQMKGLIPQIWLGYVDNKPTPKPTTKYTGVIPSPTLKKGDKGTAVVQWQTFLNWYGANCGKADGIFGDGTKSATMQFQSNEGLASDGIVGKNTIAKANNYKAVVSATPSTTVATAEKTVANCVASMKAFAKKYADDNSYKYKKWTSDVKTHQCPLCHPNSGKGWNCIGYVSAICYHGGGIKDVTCSCSGIGNDAFFQNVTLDKWKKRNGNNWSLITNNGKKLTTSMLKAGDVLLFYDKNGKWKHIGFYYGDGKFADSTSGKTQISIRPYSSTTLRCLKAFRPSYKK